MTHGTQAMSSSAGPDHASEPSGPTLVDRVAVTAHAALTEPLITVTVSGLDAILTPREAISLSEQLAAACAAIGHRRSDATLGPSAPCTAEPRPMRHGDAKGDTL